MVAALLAANRIYLGTMNIAWPQASQFVDARIASEMLQRFAAAGGDRLDTARIYASGATETTLAEALATSRAPAGGWRLGTKAAPSQPGGLSSEGVRSQFAESTGALGVSKLAEYYLHQPDPANDLLGSLVEADALVNEGLVGTVGMSNFHADEVARAFELCDKHGLVAPGVYQGLFNPLNRAVEAELLPLLKERGCQFIAYNGLAAGLLTGKHAAGGAVAAGRFKDNPNYLPRFYTDDNFRAVDAIRAACDASGVTMIDATYAWLLNHSALGATDGVLLGASSLDQLDANLNACAGGGAALPRNVVDAMDGAWDLTRPGAFKYWRSFSADFPGREDRDPGASYAAAKART
mmetsp:Transcript_8889/g.27781  ORF Transcript_8889/g.27781 Transcript_8889/m.27781 type:complete len:351 (-) Transcript_8889:161-1213(-)